jgi:hypothetical protein
MRALRFFAGIRMGWLIAGSIILASHTGCERLTGFSDSKVTVLDPRGQPTGVFGRVGAAGSGILANRNPETQPTLSMDALVPLRMAPRLDSLEDKTIYLVDVGFAGGKDFLEEVQKWFHENMPSVTTVIHVKSNSAFEDSPELWPVLKEKADGVVFGVGG